MLVIVIYFLRIEFCLIKKVVAGKKVMHLQWKEYELKNRQRSLRVEIVKSYRDKMTGQPRNKAVGYLGSIREANIKNPLARRYFWWQVETKLSRLLIPAADKEKIVKAIRDRIPF